MNAEPTDAKMKSIVLAKHPRRGRMAPALIAIAGAGCATAGAVSVRAIINGPPEAGDPPLWIFAGLAIAGVAFAVLAIPARTRPWWALLALFASILSLVSVWTLAVLFSG